MGGIDLCSHLCFGPVLEMGPKTSCGARLTPVHLFLLFLYRNSEKKIFLLFASQLWSNCATVRSVRAKVNPPKKNQSSLMRMRTSRLWWAHGQASLNPSKTVYIKYLRKRNGMGKPNSNQDYVRQICWTLNLRLTHCRPHVFKSFDPRSLLIRTTCDGFVQSTWTIRPAKLPTS
jgi:hypothetical protein